MTEASERRPKFSVIPRDEATKMFDARPRRRVTTRSVSPVQSDLRPHVLFQQPMGMDNSPKAAEQASLLESTVIPRRYPPRPERNLRNKEAREARRPKTADAVISHMRAGKRVLWERLDWSEIRGVLERLSVERGVPVSMLDVTDFLRPAELIGGKKLAGLLGYVIKQKDENESLMPFIREKTGIEVTTDDIIASIRGGRIIYWDMLPSEAVQEFKERLAQELGTSVAMLSSSDLAGNFELLGGRTARGLVRHPQNLDGSLPARRGKRKAEDPSPRIDELIEEIKSDRDVKWWRISPQVLGQLMTRAANELGLPVALFHTRNFNHQFEFLNGKSITGLATHIRVERGGIKNVLEQAGIQVTAEDVIALIQTDRKFVWNLVPIRVIGEILERAGTEVGKPVSLLMVDDLGRSYAFLSNHSLSRFKGYLRQRFDSDQGQKMDKLMERIGILMQAKDVILATKNGHRVYWDRLPEQVIQELLEMAVAENGISIEGLGVRDFMRPMAFLDGGNLSGLYEHFYNQKEERGEKDTILFILDKLGISITAEGAISRLRARVMVRWDHLPFEEIRKILEIAAAEIHVPLSMFSTVDFGKRPFEAFNGRSLGGLYAHLRKHPQKREDMSVPQFLSEALGVRATAEDILACFANEHPVLWNRVPWTETRKILDMIAAEAQIPDYMIGYPQFFRYFEALSNHRLTGLYSYALRHPEKRSEETAIAFVRRKAGLPEPPVALTRSNFRRSQIEESYQRLLPDVNFAQLQDMDEVMPWIRQIGQLYASTYLEIESDEVESEVMVLLSEELKNETIVGGAKGLLGRLHKRLEVFLHDTSRRRYKELSLQEQLGKIEGGNYTLESVIQTFDQDPFDESEELSDQMQTTLTKLSPLQRRIVTEIAVEGRDLDDVAEELNIDSDILQEHYVDALLLLREGSELREEV